MQIHRVLTVPATPVPDDIYLQKSAAGVNLALASKDTVPSVATMKRGVSLQGPTSLYHGQTGTFTIVGYSDQETYQLSSTDGTVSRTGSAISFTVTNTGLSTGSFKLNGRTISVSLNAVKPNTPSITSPVSGSTGVDVQPTVTSSAFSMNWAGSTETHLSTDWEVSTDPNFTTIVASSYNDTVNLTSWKLP